MNSRERVRAAINHQEPDRVPLDLGGNQTGIHRIAYRNLLDFLGLREEVRIMDAVQQLAEPSEKILQRLEIDTRYVRPGAFAERGPDFTEYNGFRCFRDAFGVPWGSPVREQSPLYLEIVENPLRNLKFEDLKHYPWPDGREKAPFRGLREYAAKLSAAGEYALVTGISGVVYEYCWYLRGMDQLFMDMLTEPRILEYLLDRTLEYWKNFETLFMKEVGEYVDVVCVGDDLGMQSSTLFAPAIYREFVKPRQKQLISHIKKLTRAKVWYHSCGSIYSLIPDLLDNGVDILNPVQYRAAEMDPERLKASFGKKLCFWGGGVDTQNILPHGTPSDVGREVEKQMAVFKPGGGYVFNPVHNIQPDVPPENIVAAFQTARACG